MRADQTRAAFHGRIGFNGLDRVTTAHFIERLEALRWCRENIAGEEFDIAGAWLVTFEEICDWSTWQSAVLPRSSPDLIGRGIVFVFAVVGTGVEHGNPPLRKRFSVKDTLEVQISALDDFTKLETLLDGKAKPVVFYRKNSDPFKRKD